MLAAAVISAVSLILMNVWASGAEDPTVAYLSTPSHFYPLMIGSFFACLGGFRPLQDLVKIAKTKAFMPAAMLLTCLGIACIVWMSFSFYFYDPRVYSYGLFVVSVISGAILLFAGLFQKANSQGKPPKKEWAVTNYIGLRSYSIYLYHWPAMIIAQQLATEIAGGSAQQTPVLIATIIAIPVTFIAAELSYRFIEQKFRVRRTSPATHVIPAASIAIPFKKPRLAAICIIALILGGISADAISTAPRMSGIETDLKYGAMKLDVRQLKDIHKRMDEFKSAPDGDDVPGVKVPEPAEGSVQDE
jgi:peptidoglycan/LPS O-acetylase OafA/YrhL